MIKSIYQRKISAGQGGSRWRCKITVDRVISFINLGATGICLLYWDREKNMPVLVKVGFLVINQLACSSMELTILLLCPTLGAWCPPSGWGVCGNLQIPNLVLHRVSTIVTEMPTHTSHSTGWTEESSWSYPSDCSTEQLIHAVEQQVCRSLQ